MCKFRFPKYNIRGTFYNVNRNISSRDMQRFLLWVLQMEESRRAIVRSVTNMKPDIPVLCRMSEDACSAAVT